MRGDAGDEMEGTPGMREEREERRDRGEGENLSYEDKEVKVKEQQEEKQLQSVFCFHKMTTVHKSLNFGVH